MEKKQLFLLMLVFSIFSVETIFAKGLVVISPNWAGTYSVSIYSVPTIPGNPRISDYSIKVNKDVVDITASVFQPATYYADGTLKRSELNQTFHCIMTVDTIGAKSNFNFKLYRDTADIFVKAGANMLINFYDMQQDGGCDENQLFEYSYTNKSLGKIILPDWYYSDPASASNKGGNNN